MYDWVPLLYNRNWHNIVSQLYFKFKNVKKKNQLTSVERMIELENYLSVSPNDLMHLDSDH